MRELAIHALRRRKSYMKLFKRYLDHHFLHGYNVDTNILKRKIRLRLHGTRLPIDYTICLRLASFNNRDSQPKRPARKRRRKAPPEAASKPISDSEDEATAARDAAGTKTRGSHSDVEDDAEQIHLHNAYTGSSNTIGSVHQRTWYLSLDKAASGFMKQRSKGQTRWVRGGEKGVPSGFEPFFVRGREVERSIVTGRLAADVLKDEGVEGYVGRAGWRPILE